MRQDSFISLLTKTVNIDKEYMYISTMTWPVAASPDLQDKKLPAKKPRKHQFYIRPIECEVYHKPKHKHPKLFHQIAFTLLIRK